MQNKTIVLLSIIIFTFIFVPLAFAVDNIKIGVFDYQKILEVSSAGKMTKKILTTKQAELKKKIADEKAALDKMQKNFEKEALVLTSEKQQEKQREFRIRVNDFKKMQNDFAQELKQLEIEHMKKIENDVLKIAADIGKANKHTVVFEKKTSGVVYNVENIDITEQIIKAYNLQLSKTQ